MITWKMSEDKERPDGGEHIIKTWNMWLIEHLQTALGAAF